MSNRTIQRAASRAVPGREMGVLFECGGKVVQYSERFVPIARLVDAKAKKQNQDYLEKRSL